MASSAASTPSASIASIVPVSHLSKLRIASKQETVEFFGVTPMTFNTWLKRGCPFIQEGKGGGSTGWVFDLLDVAKWRFLGRVTDTGEVNPDLMSPRERLDYYKGSREQMLMERDRGVLLPADQVEAAWSDHITVAKGRLLSLPSRVSGELLSLKTQRDIEKVIRNAVITILEELSGGTPESSATDSQSN